MTLQANVIKIVKVLETLGVGNKNPLKGVSGWAT